MSKSERIYGMALLGSEEPNVLLRTVMQRIETTTIFLPYFLSDMLTYLLIG
jgi:hypothetical protein